VTLVHRGPRILAKEDERAASIVAAAMEADGVTILLGRSAVSFDGSSATLDDGSALEFDAVLAAMGRRSNTVGLGLEAVGVELDEKGNVKVDDRLRTTNPRIWAAGDVSGLPQFTHTAGVNGSVGATNAVLGLSRSIDRDAVPRVTFTHPEVGAVGIRPSDADAHGLRVITIEHHDLDRAICDTETSGYTSLVVDRRGRIRGGTIVGPRAGESLGELGVAVKRGLTASDLAGVTHAYPTYSDGVWKAAVYDVRKRVVSGAVGRVTGVLHAVRRRRVG
jgi:pyruvate/2-oxoglutarate dehydrogenase complex dihydrolipoamide dehydrogenase (E3) component